MEIVKVQVYTGKLQKNEHGEWTTKNNPYKVRKPSKEWNLFLNNAPNMYSKVELLEVTEEKVIHGEKTVRGKIQATQKHEYNVIESPKDVVDAIEGVLKKKVNLSPEQKEIAELRAKLDALIESKPKEPKLEKKKIDEVDDEIIELRAKYKELHPENKDANKLWKERKLGEEIEKLENK